MCGIICGIGFDSVAQVVLQGLKRLEYRGYDSAGISVIKNGKIQTIKNVGKVDGLIKKADDLSGNVAIAHTRWATHGPANINNAHPHNYKNISWVHNGIINNHGEIREKLLNMGFNLSSDTDSEVMGLLFASITNDNTLTKLQECFNEFEGSFAWSIISLEFSDKIFFASKNSPLVLGISNYGCFLASDPLALLGVCDEFYCIPPDTLGWCSKDSYQVLNASNLQPIRLQSQSIALSNNSNEKKHKHYMLEEIYEQPEAVSRMLKRFWANDKPSNELKEMVEKIPKDIKMLQTIGCGSSYFATMIGKLWIQELTNLLVSCDIASEFKYQRLNKTIPTMLLALSQSGETADTLAAFSSKDFYDLRLSFCNVSHSTLARTSDFMLPILAGAEIGVASTKAFTNQILALLLFALSLNPTLEISKRVKEIPEALRQTLLLEPKIAHIASKLVHEKKMLFLGRGLLYPTALEGALKLKELTYIHAHAYPAGELKHGPLALIDDQLVTIGLIDNSNQRSKTIANFREVQARHGRLVVIYEGLDNDLQHLDMEHSLCLPSIMPIFSPIIFSVCLQLFAYHFSNLLGHDVDKPRNLAKSVTVD